MAKNSKKIKWIKPRHKFFRNLVCACVRPACKHKYHVEIEKFQDQGDRQYLVLANHQTAFDQFFVGMVFKGSVYYVASEDLFPKALFPNLSNMPLRRYLSKSKRRTLEPCWIVSAWQRKAVRFVFSPRATVRSAERRSTSIQQL